METELMVNSTLIKQLRKKAGWSQEQLAVASGLSLRTIQRVESEGKASVETKKCLSATLQISMEELELTSTLAPSKSKKVSRVLLLLIAASTGISLTGHFIDVSNPITFVANLIAIFSIIYCVFNWFFDADLPIETTAKSQFRASFIYFSVFSIFAVLGNFGEAVILPMLITLAVFSAVIFLVSKSPQLFRKKTLD